MKRSGVYRARRLVVRGVRATSLAWARRKYIPPPRPEPRAACSPTGYGMIWPAFPPRHYLGQLDPQFQRRLGAHWADVDVEDCDFYHTSVLSDGRVLAGPWDLRDRERAYLGDIDVIGERVLELGPASGAMTYFMEDEGAEVVSFDVGFDVCGDILPMPGVDPLDQRADYMRMVSRVQNSWWYLHQDRCSQAKIAYGDIYRLPGDFGSFDTSVFAAILLHLRDPFRALEEAAARTKRRIVVTDSLQDPTLDQDANLLRFASANFTNLSIWWTLTPEVVRHMLRHLGFDKLRTTLSEHTHHLGHEMDKTPVKQAMFTVVGERSE